MIDKTIFKLCLQFVQHEIQIIMFPAGLRSKILL